MMHEKRILALERFIPYERGPGHKSHAHTQAPNGKGQTSMRSAEGTKGDHAEMAAPALRFLTGAHSAGPRGP